MEFWLPVVFAGLMALAMLIYVVLDGYDLDISVFLNGGDDKEKDMMIASIGPFCEIERDLAGTGHRHPADRLSDGTRHYPVVAVS